jgi:DNA (cytosine-5)-methyltransferase 1
VRTQLVLSLFPGIGLLDMAFEEEGFCIVRGPDLLWGGDIRRFHPPAGKFDGVIGGPPCQFFSAFKRLNPAAGRHGNQIPEFERCVAEAQPRWFLMENVPKAPEPCVCGYEHRPQMVRDVTVGGATSRLRRFTFGTTMGGLNRFVVPGEALHAAEPAQAVTSAGRLVPVAMVRDGKGGHKLKRSLVVHGGHDEPFDRPALSISDMCELQGVGRDFFDEDSPFTANGKKRMIGNGVPLPMGRAVARAVKRALNLELGASPQ